MSNTTLLTQEARPFRIVTHGNIQDNKNHNIWKNCAVYWIALSMSNGIETRRIRTSLKTKDIAVARRRRDRIIRQILAEPPVAV